MHFSSVAFLAILLPVILGVGANNNASSCYGTPLPPLPASASTENRTIPWGTPSFTLPNGTTCCDSLAQVRVGINEIDAQLVELLAQRAAYVREATRFKATLDSRFSFFFSLSAVYEYVFLRSFIFSEMNEDGEEEIMVDTIELG